jgi:DNA-binding MarR family transcriptional regulator
MVREKMAEQFDYQASRRTAQILQRPGMRRSALEALAQSCALDLLPALDLDKNNLKNAITPIRRPDYLLTDLSSEPEQIDAALETITEYLNEYGTELLVWVSADQLDIVDALLPEQGRHILCDALDFEAIPILTGALGKMNLQSLKQDDSPTDYRALHRISDELADFARTLARIAEQDDPPASIVSDKPVSFRPAPVAMFEPFATKIETAIPAEAAMVRNILKLRRRRESFFDSNLFADPAWDILLDLYAAKLESKKVSVSSLCIAASVPPTTALRWISTMTEDGQLMREHDPDDARRVFIRLSDSTEESLRAYFADIALRDKAPI